MRPGAVGLSESFPHAVSENIPRTATVMNALRMARSSVWGRECGEHFARRRHEVHPGSTRQDRSPTMMQINHCDVRHATVKR